jgi:hypothetical protein
VKDLRKHDLYYKVSICSEPCLGLNVSTWVYLGEKPEGWYRFCEWNEWFHKTHFSKQRTAIKGVGHFAEIIKSGDKILVHFTPREKLSDSIQCDIEDLKKEMSRIRRREARKT